MTKLLGLPLRLQGRIRVEPNGCWRWTGQFNRNGYGRCKHKGKRVMAHRLTYTLLVGEIPPHHVLDHLCRNRWCVNPFHQEPVTVQENTLRGEAKLFGGVR